MTKRRTRKKHSSPQVRGGYILTLFILVGVAVGAYTSRQKLTNLVKEWFPSDGPKAVQRSESPTTHDKKTRKKRAPEDQEKPIQPAEGEQTTETPVSPDTTSETPAQPSEPERPQTVTPSEPTSGSEEPQNTTEPTKQDESTGSGETVPKTDEDTPGEPTPEEPKDDAYSDPLVIAGVNANSAENVRLWDNWLKRMTRKQEISKAVPKLEEKLREVAPALLNGERLDYRLYHDTKVLQQAIDLCYLAELVGADFLDTFVQSGAGKGVGEEGDGKKGNKKTQLTREDFMVWAITNPSRPLHRFLQTYKLNSGKKDQIEYAIDMFYKLSAGTKPKDRQKYLSLAIACSLVPPQRPQSSGLLPDPSEPLLNMQQIYDYYKEEDFRRRLLTDLKKLSATELLYVVDVRLPRSEFEWVNKNLSYRRENWGEAYGAVHYIMERATMGEDPYKKYTFEELKEKGGVCRDQGYFACMTARCKGIPAVYITGDGNRGGHAWVALLTADKTWTSFGSYGYNTGRFDNPCSGKRLHESTLVHRDKNLTDDKLEPAADGMLLSDFLCRMKRPQQALAAARYVTTAYPLLSAGWWNYIEVLDYCGKETVPMGTWKRVYVELEKLSKKNGELLDLAQDVQANRIMVDKDDKMKRQMLKKSGKKMGQLVDMGRADLMVDGLKRQAELLVKAKDSRGLVTFFKGQLKEYAGRADVFDQVLNCYREMIEEFEKKLAEDDSLDEKKKENTMRSLWKSAAKDAESFFSKHAFKDDDFFLIKRHHRVMFNIADCWRKAGDDKKAQRIEDDADKRLDDSTERSTPDRRRGERATRD